MYLSRTAEMKPTGGIEKASATYLGSKDISCTFAPGYNLHDFKLGIETYVSAFKSEQPEGGCDKGHSCKNARTLSVLFSGFFYAFYNYDKGIRTGVEKDSLVY